MAVSPRLQAASWPRAVRFPPPQTRHALQPIQPSREVHLEAVHRWHLVRPSGPRHSFTNPTPQSPMIIAPDASGFSAWAAASMTV
jgi:hypothetical protein